MGGLLKLDGHGSQSPELLASALHKELGFCSVSLNTNPRATLMDRMEVIENRGPKFKCRKLYIT